MTIRKLKFRRPIFINDKFDHFSYWGVEMNRAKFVLPETGVDHKSDEQFTSLLDMQGTDIYEGDIIRSDKNCMRTADYEKSEVIFYESCFRVQDIALSIIVQAFHPIIVGNIHENPELLKGGD